MQMPMQSPSYAATRREIYGIQTHAVRHHTITGDTAGNNATTPLVSGQRSAMQTRRTLVAAAKLLPQSH